VIPSLKQLPSDRGFVVGADIREDDVFLSASYQPPFRRGGMSRSAEATPTGKKAGFYLTDNWRTSGTTSEQSSSPIRQISPNGDGVAATQVDFGRFPETPVRITSHNAQLILPPSACIFVAK
jgi:hypothetical protein